MECWTYCAHSWINCTSPLKVPEGANRSGHIRLSQSSECPGTAHPKQIAAIWSAQVLSGTCTVDWKYFGRRCSRVQGSGIITHEPSGSGAIGCCPAFAPRWAPSRINGLQALRNSNTPTKVKANGSEFLSNIQAGYNTNGVKNPRKMVKSTNQSHICRLYFLV